MCVPVEDKGGGRDRGIEKLHGASTGNTWIRARERGRETLILRLGASAQTNNAPRCVWD